MKKIAIGLPSATGTVRMDWSIDLAGLCTKLMAKGYAVVPIAVCRSFVTDARNGIIKRAVEMEADYVFFLDDDTYIEAAGVIKMIELDKDIASPPVADRKGGVYLNIFDDFLHKQTALEKTMKVKAVGSATTLIKIEVIKKLLEVYEYPYEFQIGTSDEGKTPISEDVGFCLRAEKYGFETWAVKGIKTWHLGDPKKYSYAG